MSKNLITIDGNTAAAKVAYAFSEVAAIYPITPSSNMGEYSEQWATEGKKNLFGKTVDVIEMQSEAGAAGAVHGALSAGALTTTFTASQGLLLMIPNMYKIAGEMLPTVFHVSARSLAAQSLSIFGDHSDVMSVRQTGYAMTSACNIQETLDLALVAHLSTLKAEIPFVAFFDGFRTSHEFCKIEDITDETMKELIEIEYIEKFRNRAMRPEAPYVKVAAQNPDVYFQGRETSNKQYEAIPSIVQEYMDKVAKKVGRQYHLFDYVGAPDADRVIICMGSGCDTIEETIKYLNARGQKVGAIKVRLYRPFSAKHFIDAIPASVKKIAVLDRTKEPGSLGEPLFQDVVTALYGKNITIIGGRYGLSSKEFTPSHVKAIYDHLNGKCFHSFTVGINDDVTNLSLPITEEIVTEAADVVRCMFWGVGSDGTVGANKNSIKIIGDNTNKYAQAYFSYDSKKSGGVTVSHLRFGDSEIKSPYLITEADFVACHVQAYIGRFDMLKTLKTGGVFLLNSEYSNDEVFNHLTKEMQETIIKKKIRFYNINAYEIADKVGLVGRTNTVMQAAFFTISGILPQDEAISLIKKYIEKTYGKKGMAVVEKNWKCVDASVEALKEIQIPATITKSYVPAPLLPANADAFAKNIIEPSMRQEGDNIPVSQMSIDGSLPIGTAALEKRGVAVSVPKWISENCIQCNQCVMACPHASIRTKMAEASELKGKPASFNTIPLKPSKKEGLEFRLQVFCEDCQGCGVCIETCPAKVKALEFSPATTEIAAGQRENADFFEKNIAYGVKDGSGDTNLKGVQFKQPLFEFSGACAGCGETPYVKLVTQLFGERMIISNATGCSSIYGGTFPTIPYTKGTHGQGPTWGNSLFEDNAEYGFGFRLAIDSNRKLLKQNVDAFLPQAAPQLKSALEKSMSLWESKADEAIVAQQELSKLLVAEKNTSNPLLKKIVELRDYFVDKSVWIFGGDGWAYDIGFGGLDHVVSTNKNVNILVMDTEVYSNTGGQASKSTPIGAVAKFATDGMRSGKKNLGFMCMSYGNVYVASISMGANRSQTLKAFQEAEAWNGPSIILAYSPCINHGINMMKSQVEQKRAVESGYFPLYRYNPALEEGKRFTWESKPADGSFQEFIRSEGRYTQLLKTAPNDAERLFKEAEADNVRRNKFMEALGGLM